MNQFLRASAVFAFAALTSMTASSVFAADNFGSQRHISKGLTCETCHGPDKANPKEPTTDTCTQCHNVSALVAKTAKVKPTNPHTSPHYQDRLDCINCHLQHDTPQNFCNQCHTFDFKVR